MSLVNINFVTTALSGDLELFGNEVEKTTMFHVSYILLQATDCTVMTVAAISHSMMPIKSSVTDLLVCVYYCLQFKCINLQFTSVID